MKWQQETLWHVLLTGHAHATVKKVQISHTYEETDLTFSFHILIIHNCTNGLDGLMGN